MIVPQPAPNDPADVATRDLIDHETTRRVVWRLLLDLAEAPAAAVVRAAETVTVDELALLAPASGSLYRLMIETAETGRNPDAVTLLSAALAGGYFNAANGDRLNHVLVSLAGSSGEALRLEASLRDVLALMVRSRAATLGYSMAQSATTAGELDLRATVTRDATELLALMQRLEAYDRSRGVPVEPVTELIKRKAVA